MIKLEVNNLTKTYASNLVFSGLSFHADSPVIGIAGENGSGKSTLLKCISGLIKPTSGKVSWHADGAAVKKEDLKEILGFSAPYIQLYEELTVWENLEFIIRVRDKKVPADPNSLLEFLDAGSFAGSPFGELSTGQQQRAKLAAALIHNPKILMLDEPGSNLDKKGKQNVKEIVQRFRQNGAMILIASNQKQELDLCDQIIEL